MVTSMLTDLASVVDEPFFVCAAEFVMATATQVGCPPLDRDVYGSGDVYDGVDGPKPMVPDPPGTAQELGKAVVYMAGLQPGFVAAYVLRQFASASQDAVARMHTALHAGLASSDDADRFSHFYRRVLTRGFDIWNLPRFCCFPVDIVVPKYWELNDMEDDDEYDPDDPDPPCFDAFVDCVVDAVHNVTWTNYFMQLVCMEFIRKHATGTPGALRAFRAALLNNMADLRLCVTPPHKLLYACAFAFERLLTARDFSMCSEFQRTVLEPLLVTPLALAVDDGEFLMWDEWFDILGMLKYAVVETVREGPGAVSVVQSYPALVEGIVALEFHELSMRWSDVRRRADIMYLNTMCYLAATGEVWATQGWLADAAMTWLTMTYCVNNRRGREECPARGGRVSVHSPPS
jgi:hypothetical protein